MRVPQLSAVLLMLSNPVFASGIDWQAAEGGVVFQERLAYSGCAKLTLAAEMAKKVATVRAVANAARARNLVVSGEEHLTVSEHDDLKYTITETSRAILHHTTVLYEEVVDIEGDHSLCVLVAEE